MKKQFIASQKRNVHFYHLLQIEYDLENSFKECSYQDNTITEDIFVAISIWIKDSEVGDKDKLSMQDIIAFIVNILQDYNYLDVAEQFQNKAGFSILSKEKLYHRLSNVIKRNRIPVGVGIKTKVYEQLKKLGYKADKLSSNLIQEIALQELKSSKTKEKRGVETKLKNLPNWVEYGTYGYIYLSFRFEIDIQKLFKKQTKEDFLMEFFVNSFLIESFGELAYNLLQLKNYLSKFHYFSIFITNIPPNINHDDIRYYIESKIYPSLPKTILIRLHFSIS